MLRAAGDVRRAVRRPDVLAWRVPRWRAMVRRPHELECWQLADELRREVLAICAQDAIVQFFGYALGSLGEMEDYLGGCVVRNFIDQEWSARGLKRQNTLGRRR